MDDVRGGASAAVAARQMPWQAEVAVPFPADAGFTPWEHWAWARIVRGGSADMRYFPVSDEALQRQGGWIDEDQGGKDPCNATNWPEHRVLSANFMRTILFYEPWSKARVRSFVRISHAKFVENLDWENEVFLGEISMQNSQFSGELNWLGFRAGLIGLRGSCFEETLVGDRLRTDGGLFCANARFKKTVRLHAASVGGQAVFSGSKLDEALEADGIQVSGALFCSDGFHAKKSVRLLGATINGIVGFNDAILDAGLHADGITVNGDVFCSKGFHSKGEIRLLGATIGGDLAFVGATLDAPLECAGIVIKGSCYLRDMQRLDSVGMTTGRFERLLDLSGSNIEGRLNLTGASIANDLVLAQFDGDEIKWGERARLILRNTTAGALAAGIGAFRRGKKFVRCELSGFVYGRLGGLRSDDSPTSLAQADARELRRWLRSCCPAAEGFEPGPYRTLAKALVDAGYPDKAADIRNELGDHERTARHVKFGRRVLLSLSGLIIGYGQRNHRAFVLFAMVVAAGAVVGYWQDLISRPLGSPVGWYDLRAWLDWGGFAFGNSVPLVVIDPAHTTFLQDRFCLAQGELRCETPDIPFGLTAFFYTAKILGFVILSYLAAGLTGLAQRRD